MDLIFEEKNGIGVLTNNQLIDLSYSKEICLIMPDKYTILEVNKLGRYPIKDGKVKLPITKFIKGTNTLRAINDTMILPLQPIFISAVGDKIQCQLATNLDVLSTIEELREQVFEINKFISSIKQLNLTKVIKKVNDLIEISKNLQERVADIEKNYDPTMW